MSDIVVSPNMNLPVPVVSQEIGPDWATDINACMSAIDSHNHSSGQGVQIGVAGINIDGSLVMNEQNLTRINAALFTQINAALTSLLRSLQVVSKDLYYIDGDGNSVRITQGGSVTGATGTITGLPSGTASASFSGATFTFNSATNTKATMSVGPVAIGSTTANGKQTTISSASAQPSDLTLVLPQAAGAANTVLSNDGSSNTSWATIGSVLSAGGIGSNSVDTGTGTLVTLTNKTLNSLSLVAGTWILSGSVVYSVSGGGDAELICAITTTPTSTTGTLGLNVSEGFIMSGIGTMSVPFYIVSPGSTTTYYFSALADPGGTYSSSLSAVRIA